MCLTDSGTIDFMEFVAMMASTPRQKTQEQMIVEAFHRFDVDGDGVLSREELRQAMISMGEDLPDEEIDDMIREADDNGDGVIDFKGMTRTHVHIHQNTHTHTHTHTYSKHT